MRSFVVACALVLGCAGHSPPATPAPDAASELQCEVSAPARCGAGPCQCCAACSLKTDLCLGNNVQFTFDAGTCIAAPATGSFAVTIAGATFDATAAAGGVDGAYLELVAHAGDQTVALLVPSAPGDYSCASFDVTGISYFQGDTLALHNRPGSPRPACAVSVQSVGAVGQVLSGTFSATVTDGTTTLDLTGGVFNLTRSPYP